MDKNEEMRGPHVNPYAQNGLCQACAPKQLSLVRLSSQSFKR
jgi:hypothetical protein